MDSNDVWFVYALFSTKCDRLYIGMSKDPENRLSEHNRGKTKSTKGYRPWELVFIEKVGNRQAARKKEKFYKTYTGRNIIRNLISNRSNKLRPED